MSQVDLSVLRECHLSLPLHLVKKPNSCKEPVGVTSLHLDTERSDRTSLKRNQASSKHKKLFHPHLSDNFQPLVTDGCNDILVDCEQATEHNKPKLCHQHDFFNDYCESDKCSSGRITKTLNNPLHSEFSKHDGDHVKTEVDKLIHRQDSVQQNANCLALNDQTDVEHYPGSSNTINSKYQTGTVTETTTKASHIWSRDNAAVIDLPYTHPEKTMEKNEGILAVPSKPQYYHKSTYVVLIRDEVKVVNTKLYASLPSRNKYIVKERIPGMNKVKLALKSSDEDESEVKDGYKQKLTVNEDEIDGLAPDEIGERLHHRENCRNPGYIIYTCDKRFNGNMKYPIPSGRATDNKIGKGGNGFVFVMFHERKQYAVKKTVYRPNEVNVHAALKHDNILPLLAVLMGERHERHSSKFYCFHFMPKMDYDLRQILSVKEIGCLKHLYAHCSKDLGKFNKAYNNIKFILRNVLKALAYLHSNGYVHRDVKASNIMIKMRCKCNPLYCNCSSKFQVTLGDFDSAGTVPGLGIKEPTDQMIKFASILPLGTPGYRAPEVSMHITLSGPYETLYTFAVDMWSFGCLCLNICIGKTAALKQREEAALLLSQIHQCSKELWEKTTKVHELERTEPFLKDLQMLSLIRSCLQVDSKKRPSALNAQTFLEIKS